MLKNTIDFHIRNWSSVIIALLCFSCSGSDNSADDIGITSDATSDFTPQNDVPVSDTVEPDILAIDSIEGDSFTPSDITPDQPTTGKNDRRHILTPWKHYSTGKG